MEVDSGAGWPVPVDAAPPSPPIPAFCESYIGSDGVACGDVCGWGKDAPSGFVVGSEACSTLLSLGQQTVILGEEKGVGEEIGGKYRSAEFRIPAGTCAKFTVGAIDRSFGFANGTMFGTCLVANEAISPVVDGFAEKGAAAALVWIEVAPTGDACPLSC